MRIVYEKVDKTPGLAPGEYLTDFNHDNPVPATADLVQFGEELYWVQNVVWVLDKNYEHEDFTIYGGYVLVRLIPT